MEFQKRCLIVTTFIGFGDLLYHTPIFRKLKKKGCIVDVWTRNPEPFLNNPNIDNLYQIRSSNVPIPTIFYPWGHFIVGNQMAGVAHPHSHVVDYVTANLFRVVYLAEEKHLDLFWSEAQSQLIGERLKNVPRPFVAMSPVIGWPSRTMPVEWYAEIATRVRAQGFGVVLVGRDVNPRDIGSDNDKLDEYEQKKLHPADAIPHDLCLYNQTNLHELGALYDQSPVVLTTETGHLPIAGCSDRCHIVYAGSLIHPEHRMPFRKGFQKYKATIVHTKEAYYPAYARMLEDGVRLIDIETRTADAYDVAIACINALRGARSADRL